MQDEQGYETGCEEEALARPRGERTRAIRTTQRAETANSARMSIVGHACREGVHGEQGQGEWQGQGQPYEPKPVEEAAAAWTMRGQSLPPG